MKVLYLTAADLIVVIHAAYAGFVVFGLIAILAGIVFRWEWVRNFWFRMIHFVMIAIVVAEALVGSICPLTTWEDQLRANAGVTVQKGTFIGRICEKLLFFGGQDVVRVSQCIFGAVVLLTLVLAPPQRPTGPRWLVHPRKWGG